MKHTAIIGNGIPVVQITFNCSNPANSVTGTFGPGTTSGPDNCGGPGFVSATIVGVTIAVGASLNITIDGVSVRATCSTEDMGRSITVELQSK